MIAVAAATAAAQGSALEAFEAEQQAVFEAVAPSVVYIVTDQGLGSGFFVDADGLVLTAAHVVEGTDRPKLVRNDGGQGVGTVVERNRERDLALVATDWRATPALVPSSRAALRVGSWVASVGHGEGGGWSYTTGTVSNLYPNGHERPVFQTQIPLNPGNSGGPIVDRFGEVVGVVTSGLHAAQNINFATRIEVAASALAGMPMPADRLLVHAPAGVTIFVDGTMVGIGPRAAVPLSPGTHEVMSVVGARQVKVRVSWPEQREVTISP